MHSRILVAAVLFAGAYATAMPCYAEVAQMSVEKLNSMIAAKAAVTVVDVRGGYDFQKEHIPGAIHAAYNTINKAALPREGALVLYCGNNKCPLSHLAAKTLENAGYTNTAVLLGGIEAWAAKGLAVQTAAGVQQRSAVVKTAVIMPGKLRKRLTDKAIGILDLRPAKDFRIAHIQGAKNLPLENLAGAAAALAKDKEWIVYDAQAGRAKSGAQILAGKEFKVRELSGGMQVWAAKKYPMESGEEK